MTSEANRIWNESKKNAILASSKWDLKTTRGALVAEYAERRWLFYECSRLNTHICSLGGRIGALKKRIAALEKGGGK